MTQWWHFVAILLMKFKLNMATKKLYKFRTQTVLNETFEVEAESYDQAVDFIFDGADNHEDDYPSQAERTGWWYEEKQYSDDDDCPGLVAISITEEQADKTPYYDIYKPESIVLGYWREPTDEEIVDDEKQAVADGRLDEKFASYT